MCMHHQLQLQFDVILSDEVSHVRILNNGNLQSIVLYQLKLPTYNLNMPINDPRPNSNHPSLNNALIMISYPSALCVIPTLLFLLNGMS